ncbi:MAG: InlB B-repeat-containing protein, partial [Clostridia bacterium]|nr:InlB B-repeat-containing protein [Clostridia bacterium]
GNISKTEYVGKIYYKKDYTVIVSKNYNLEQSVYSEKVYGNGYEDSRETLTIPFKAATHNNYNFVGWTNNSSSTTATWTSGSKEFNDNETLYAVWTREVVVTYNANGATSGNCPSNSSGNCYLNYNATKTTEAEIVLAQNNLQKTGYSPNGWNTEADGQGLHYNNSVFVFTTNDIELYSQWSANTYNVKYNGNGATGGNTANSVHTYDVAKNLTANGFEKKHTITYNHNYTGSTNTTQTVTYAFSKWNTVANGSGTNYSNQQSVTNLATNGTFNLYAQWISSSVVLPTPTRTGYSFAGWYSDSSCSNFVNYGGASYIPTENKTLYAKWTLSPYDITVNFKNADQMEKVIVTKDASATISASGQKFTATYTGQYKLEFTPKFGYYVTNIVVDGVSKNVTQTENNTINNTSYINLTPNLFTQDTTIIVETAVKTYTVTFDGNGGLCGENTSVTKTAYVNQDITLPVFTNEGYVFKGWSCKDSKDIVIEASVTQTALKQWNDTLELSAVWAKINTVYLRSTEMEIPYDIRFSSGFDVINHEEWYHFQPVKDCVFEYEFIFGDDIPKLPEIVTGLGSISFVGWNLNGYILNNNVETKFYDYMFNEGFSAFPVFVGNSGTAISNSADAYKVKLIINDGEYGTYQVNVGYHTDTNTLQVDNY